MCASSEFGTQELNAELWKCITNCKCCENLNKHM
jgi:hypothetical protein